MKPVRRAVIDVGTNSVKLLVAEVAGPAVHPVWEGSRQTRLGKGFYETHRLRPQAIAETAQAVAAFAATAREQGARSLRVIATSAARDAKNPGDLTSAIERASGLMVEVISGEQEADWAYQGVTTDPALTRQPLLLLDVGGGSSEFILGQGEHKHFRRSFPLGTVRLQEKLPPGDPPAEHELASCRRWIREFLEKEVRPDLAPALRRESQRGDRASGIAPVQLIGNGGTATILGRMALQMEGFDRERLEGVRLNLGDLQRTTARLWGLPLAERQRVPGLPANRADVILFGVAICESVMEQFGFGELRLSTRGLRFAAVMDEL